MFRFLSCLILMLIAALALTGCGDQVRVGVVVDRDFEPAHQEMYFVQQYAGQTCSGQPQVCTPRYNQVPAWRPVDDEWRLQIEGCKAKEDDYERHDCAEKDRRWVTVGENTYDRVADGEWFEVR